MDINVSDTLTNRTSFLCISLASCLVQWNTFHSDLNEFHEGAYQLYVHLESMVQSSAYLFISVTNILQRVARKSWSKYCEAVESSGSTTRSPSSAVNCFGRLVDWNVVAHSCALHVSLSLSTFSRSLLSALEPLYSQLHSSSQCFLLGLSSELSVSSSPLILSLLLSSGRSGDTIKRK